MNVRINHNSFAYTDQGKGIPVVFIHAFPLNRQMWSPQVSALQEQFRVITLDLRGHGESSLPSQSYTIDDLASDVTSILDHLAIRRAVLVGLSMGGYVLFAFYRRFAERVKGLVLSDTRPQADNTESRAGRIAMIRIAETKGAEAVADLMLPKLLCPASLQTRPDLVRNVRFMIERTPVTTIQRDLKAMADRADATPLLDAITCPTLLLVGELDIATPPSDAQRLVDGIPHAVLEIIPGAAHLPNLEQPTTFNRALVSFMKTLSCSTSEKVTDGTRDG